MGKSSNLLFPKREKDIENISETTIGSEKIFEMYQQRRQDTGPFKDEKRHNSHKSEEGNDMKSEKSEKSEI